MNREMTTEPHQPIYRVIDNQHELDALPYRAVILELLPVRATGADWSRVWERWRGHGHLGSDPWVPIGGAIAGDSPRLPVLLLYLPPEGKR